MSGLGYSAENEGSQTAVSISTDKILLVQKHKFCRIFDFIFHSEMTQAQTISLYQPMLQTIAYNLVRCKEDAEDIVQETFARWLTVDHQKIENTKAYLIRAVTNNCLNHLQSLRRKKEQYIDSVNLSELVHRFKEMNLSHLDFDANISAAWRIMHQKLEPLERAVYVLKEVCDFDYEELQKTLDKKKDHCRQLFCRAKKKMEDETARLHFEMPDTGQWIDSFKKACHFGNASDLIQELKKDISEAVQKNF